MKKYEVWEGIVLLLTAIILLPIWLTRSGKVKFSPIINTLLEYSLYPLLIVLGVILVRRIRRIINAFRDNKNRPGTF